MCCDCYFCEERRFTLNNKLEMARQNWVIYKDDNVFVTPDIAPVVKGHFLIVTNHHMNSLANGNLEIYKSFLKAKEYLKQKIYKSENVLFFEHGAVIPHTAGGCIDHAHIHAIPLEYDIDIDGFLEKYHLLNTSKVKITYNNLQEFAKKEIPYILYETNKEGVMRKANKIPSQFFRLLISNYYPKEYNWKIQYKANASKKLLVDTLNMACEN